MSDPVSPQNEGRAFRWTIGLLVMLTAIGGFAALFRLRVPSENKDAMMFALGAVFQWAAGVVASEYGSSTTGRKVVEAAVRSIERGQPDSPSGTESDPLNTRITNQPDDPANVRDQGS